MAWTQPTAIFFLGIVLMLIVMIILELKFPTIDRKGFLPMSTTRGDRLFIGLVSAAYIHLGFIAVSTMSIWVAFAVSILWLGTLLRWG